MSSTQNTLSNIAIKYSEFKDLVKSNAPYDLKKHGYSERDICIYSLYQGQKFRYDDYGNYNYGVAAIAYGISLDNAIRAAGIYQVYSGTGFLSNPSGWFDEPRDTQMIIEEYNYNFK
jgi:hypothetical protein